MYVIAKRTQFYSSSSPWWVDELDKAICYKNRHCAESVCRYYTGPMRVLSHKEAVVISNHKKKLGENKIDN